MYAQWNISGTHEPMGSDMANDILLSTQSLKRCFWQIEIIIISLIVDIFVSYIH